MNKTQKTKDMTMHGDRNVQYRQKHDIRHKTERQRK